MGEGARLWSLGPGQLRWPPPSHNGSCSDSSLPYGITIYFVIPSGWLWPLSPSLGLLWWNNLFCVHSNGCLVQSLSARYLLQYYYVVIIYKKTVNFSMTCPVSFRGRVCHGQLASQPARLPSTTFKLASHSAAAAAVVIIMACLLAWFWVLNRLLRV